MSQSSLNIGLTALIAAQRALDVAGSNIANANTPGYARRIAELRATPAMIQPFGAVGAGVTLDAVLRVKDELLAQRLATQMAGLGDAEVRSQFMREIEALFTEPSDLGLGSAMSSFFNAVRELSVQADDPALRLTVIEEASALARRFTDLDQNLTSLQAQLTREIEVRVSEINDISRRIAEISQSVRSAVAMGQESNAALDERDALIDQLSRFGAVTTLSNDDGSFSVILGTHAMVVGGQTYDLEVGQDDSGRVVPQGAEGTVDLGPGEVSALQRLRGDTLASYRANLDSLARALMEDVNRIHARSVGVNGGYESLSASYRVGDSTAALATQDMPFDITAGELVVSVTHAATGAIEQTVLTIDPETQSFQDIAAALASVAHLNTTVANGRLSITAEDGYAFDFTGRLNPAPGALGTAAVTVSGAYTGAANGTYTVTALGDGSVGVTPGLQVQVSDPTGAVVGVFDVGEGYQPGDAIDIGAGLSLALDSGAISSVGPDSLDVQATADADTANLLGALGIGAFFCGTGASDITVNPELMAHPERMACSNGTGGGDNSALLAILDLQTQASMGDGTQTPSDFYESLIVQVGFDTQQAGKIAQTQRLLVTSLENRRDEVSGVSVDEELLDLMRFQRAFQSAARFVGIVSEISDTLVRM